MPRVRTVEVPLCDLCERDGRPFLVTPVGSPSGFTIVRCERHIAKLAASAEQDAVVESNGRSNGRTAPGDTMSALLADVIAHPGEHPRDYAERIGHTNSATYAAAKRLREEGLVRAKGTRQTVVYFPTARGTRSREPEPHPAL